MLRLMRTYKTDEADGSILIKWKNNTSFWQELPILITYIHMLNMFWDTQLHTLYIHDKTSAFQLLCLYTFGTCN
jgi:hypothetical protein